MPLGPSELSCSLFVQDCYQPGQVILQLPIAALRYTISKKYNYVYDHTGFEVTV